MPLHVIDAVCEPSGKVNEDIAGGTNAAAWVMDGATGLGDEQLLPGASDAAWLVRRVDAFLRAHADDTSLEVTELFAGAIEDVRTAYRRSKLRDAQARYELPSAEVVFVRCASGGIEYARLGDCTGVFALGGDVVSMDRSRLHSLDGQVLDKVRALQRQGVQDYTSLRRAISAALRANRNLANVAGGYWVLGLEPEAADHMETGAISLDRPATVLLMSDGFYRAVDTFQVIPEDRLVAQAMGGGLAAVLAAVRRLETGDAECLCYPRLKPHDDATALLFEIDALH
jgi:Protein phosphatase 2C